MSLYRTYRPQSFDDVVGQDHIITTLRQAVSQDKLSHAYLFAGVRGTGKTSTARILAKHLLTRNIDDDILKKQVLQAFDEGNLVDLTEIDAASNTGVDNIRELIEKIQFTPVVASAKVYIIDEVHMLSKGAFNALLKTLEEPPAYAFFILATTELHKIPATIQSRCQRFLFRQIREEDIVQRLRAIAGWESIDVEDDALQAIARHVQGGLRDAVSLLDQLRSLPKITLEEVRERVGETGHEYVVQVLEAIGTCERATIIRTVKNLEETGIPLENFVRLLLAAIRDDLHRRINTGDDTMRPRQMLEVLLQCVRDIRIAPVPGLVLESTLLSLCEKGGSRSAPSLPDLPPPPAPPRTPAPPHFHAEPAASPPDPAPVSKAPPTENASMTELRDIWPAIVDRVLPASARMSLKNGQLHAMEGATAIVRFSSAFHRDKASVPEGMQCAETDIAKTLGKKVRLKYVLDSDLHGPLPQPQEEQVDLASAALDVF